MFASAPATAADCYQTAETCVEGPETRNIGGYPVQRDCWRYPRVLHLRLAEQHRRLPAPARPRLQPGRFALHGHEPPGRLHALRADLAVPRRHGHHLDGDELWRPTVLPGRPLLRHRIRAGRRLRASGRRTGGAARSGTVPRPEHAGGLQGLRQPLPQETLRAGELLQRWRYRRLALLHLQPDHRRRRPSHRRHRLELHLRRALHGRRARPGDRRLRGAFRCRRRFLGARWADRRRPVGGLLRDLAGTGPVDDRDARDPALGPAVLRGRRAGPRDEARQPSVPRRRQLLLGAAADHPHLHRDHRDLLLLQLAPVAHHQRTGSRATWPRLGRRPGPRLQRLRAHAAPGAGLLAHGPHRVLCRDRTHAARTSATCSSVPSRRSTATSAHDLHHCHPVHPKASTRARRDPRSVHCSPCRPTPRRHSAFR